jgi:hypothetical protein
MVDTSEPLKTKTEILLTRSSAFSEKLIPLQEHVSLSCSVQLNLVVHYASRVVNSRRMRWAGHVARMVEERGVHRVLVGKPEGKRPLGRPRRRWEDNIQMDLQEVGCKGMDWIGLAQDRDRWRALVNAVMYSRVP